jgi:hypothetical protein
MTGVEVTDTAQVTFDGFAGTRVRLTMPTGIPDCDYLTLWRSPPDSRLESWNHVTRQGWVHEMWILDVDGLRFVIDAGHAPSAPDEIRDELRDMVYTIDILTE